MAAVCLYTAPCPSGWEVFINKCSRISHWSLSYLPSSCGWHHLILSDCSCSYSCFFPNCGPCSTRFHLLLQPTCFHCLLGNLPVLISWKSVVSILVFYILPVINGQSLFWYKLFSIVNFLTILPHFFLIS